MMNLYTCWSFSSLALVLAGALVYAQDTKSQPTAVTVIVRDATTGKAVKDIEVRAVAAGDDAWFAERLADGKHPKDLDRISFTDENGVAVFQSLDRRGSYILTINEEKFKKLTDPSRPSTRFKPEKGITIELRVTPVIRFSGRVLWEDGSEVSDVTAVFRSKSEFGFTHGAGGLKGRYELLGGALPSWALEIRALDVFPTKQRGLGYGLVKRSYGVNLQPFGEVRQDFIFKKPDRTKISLQGSVTVNGKPFAGSQVHVWNTEWTMGVASPVDERGQFEVYDLPSGSFFVWIPKTPFFETVLNDVLTLPDPKALQNRAAVIVAVEIQSGQTSKVRLDISAKRAREMPR